jgi:nitrite reductase/ring-hydroxylating ferredoxin subunit
MKSRFPTGGDDTGRDPTVDELVPRRTFLVRFGVTVAAMGASHSLGCGSGGSEESDGSVNVGNIKDVPIGHFAGVPGKQLVLARDTDGLYALSTVCTHLGCDMAEKGKISASGLECACHGSRFSLAGAVLAGPATKPLPHFKVDLATDGAITVQAGTIVANAVRTPVISS